MALKIGDIETDPDGSEWVIIEVFTNRKPSRVRKDSLAHRVHAENYFELAKSLKENVGRT